MTDMAPRRSNHEGTTPRKVPGRDLGVTFLDPRGITYTPPESDPHGPQTAPQRSDGRPYSPDDLDI